MLRGVTIAFRKAARYIHPKALSEAPFMVDVQAKRFDQTSGSSKNPKRENSSQEGSLNYSYQMDREEAVPFPIKRGREKLTPKQFPLLPPANKGVVIQDLEDVVPQEQLSPVEVSSSLRLTGLELWRASRLARENKAIRRTHHVCVVGGKESIKRIWHEYHIRPNVVYVPNISLPDEEEQIEDDSRQAVSSAPSWCWASPTLPTYIVRCSPVRIQRQLLHAERSSPYAAEFSWHPSLLCPLSLAFNCTEKTSREKSSITSMLVLVGLRIPSNVGMLIHAAEALGFSSIALVHCLDPFQEKVIRASEGTVFSPKLQLYEYDQTVDNSASLVSLLSNIAAQHRLCPLLAVPSQEEESAFELAKRFHTHNRRSRVRSSESIESKSISTALVPHSQASNAPTFPLGPMLVLGGEARGLEALGDSAWSVPFLTVTLPIPNPSVDSLNVAAAGSILMNLFRPSAESQFNDIVTSTGDFSPLFLSDKNSDE